MTSKRQEAIRKQIKQMLALELQLKRKLDAFYSRLGQKYEKAYIDNMMDGVLSAITNSEDELNQILLQQGKIIAGKVGSYQANILLKSKPQKLRIKISDADIENDLTAFLLERANRSVYLISQTERRIAARIIEVGIKEGLGIPTIAKDLRKNTQGIRGKAIASRIARTETGIIGSHARQRGADIAANQGIDFDKQWVAVDDARTRNAHNLADNQIVKMDELFVVGGEPMKHPHDLTASAGNVINCRCVVSYIPRDI